MKFIPSFKLLILSKAAACMPRSELEHGIGSSRIQKEPIALQS